jgi:starch synthase
MLLLPVVSLTFFDPPIIIDLPMSRKVRVALVSPEISPFAGSGDLGDFCSALPARISALGVDISLFLPRYSTPGIQYLEAVPVVTDLQVPVGPEKIKAGIHEVRGDDYSLFLVDHPKYFLRENVYGTATGDYLDNDERFIFFSRAVVEFLRYTGMPPDVLHCQDWPTALIPVFLKTHYGGDLMFQNTATVLTIHDFARQGEFPAESLALTGLNWSYFTPGRLSMNGKFNFLLAGMVFADLVNLAEPSSPRNKNHPPGPESVLAKPDLEIASIRNGIDEASWGAAAREYHRLYLKAAQLKTGGSIVH